MRNHEKHAEGTEQIPALSRRRLLTGLAAAATAATGIRAEASIALEDAELLALADRMPSLIAAQATAQKVYFEAINAAWKVWLRVSNDMTGVGGSDCERGPNGYPIQGGAQVVPTPSGLRSSIEGAQGEVARKSTTPSKRGVKGALVRLEKYQSALPHVQRY